MNDKTHYLAMLTNTFKPCQTVIFCIKFWESTSKLHWNTDAVLIQFRFKVVLNLENRNTLF